MDTLDLNSGRRAASRAGFAVLLCVSLTMALQFLGFTLFKEAVHDAWLNYIIVMLPQYAVAMPLAVLLLRKLPSAPMEKSKLSALRFGGILLICFAIIYVANTIGTLINLLIQSLSQTDMTNPVSDFFIGSGVWPNLLFAVLLSPVAEELLYRKVIASKLLPYGERPAIVLSALAFGLAHGNLSQFCYAFGLGLVFGYVFVKTGKITYTILLHIILNLFGSVFSVLAIGAGPDAAMVYQIGTLCLAIIGLVVFLFNIKRMKTISGLFSIPKGKAAVFLNPGTILMYIGCAALFVVSAIGSIIHG